MNNNLNNFNELGLVPIPSNIEKLDVDIALTNIIKVLYDDNDKALKKIYDYFETNFSRFGFKPSTSIENGIDEFLKWYKLFF